MSWQGGELVNDHLRLRALDRLRYGRCVEGIHLNDGDPERAKFLSPRFGMGHGRHDVSLAHQLGEQWLANSAGRVCNKDPHRASRLKPAARALLAFPEKRSSVSDT